jgi:NTE family protein
MSCIVSRRDPARAPGSGRELPISSPPPEPRCALQDWLSPGKLISYYDISALKGTLERLVDFDRINNAQEMRLSVGAVNVRSGQFAYFDSAIITIRPEHVTASAALPPGFPPVEIDGDHYWDGGIFSNTPLQYLLDYSPRRSRLTFQVDMFQAQGRLPTNLDEVNERDNDIRYSSRTQISSNAFRDRHDVRHAINGCTNCCRRISRTRNRPSACPQLSGHDSQPGLVLLSRSTMARLA